jgi:hypothetical protein
VLAPATTPPVVNECSQQLTFSADGNAGPLTCPDGSLNVVAWADFAGNHPSVMSLGPDATPGDVVRAECADVAHSTIPIETSAVELATTYYGWKFAFDPTAGLPSGICHAPTGGTTSWASYTDSATGFTVQYPPSWSVVLNGEQTILRDNADGAYFLVEHRQPAGPSALGAWQSLETTFAQQHQGYQRVGMTGNDQAATWQYTYSDGSQTLEAVDYGFIVGGGRYGFAFNYQAPAATFGALLPTFQQIAQTFTNPPGT